MKNQFLLILLLCFSACSTPKQQAKSSEIIKPQFSVSGHYSETINGDPETMRKAVEIQSVIAKEKTKMGIE